MLLFSTEFLLFLLCALTLATGALAAGKGRHFLAWCFWAVILTPPIAFILVALLPVRRDRLEAFALVEKEARRCPDCDELIRFRARVCRFCGRRLEPEEIQVEPSLEDSVAVRARALAEATERRRRAEAAAKVPPMSAPDRPEPPVLALHARAVESPAIAAPPLRAEDAPSPGEAGERAEAAAREEASATGTDGSSLSQREEQAPASSTSARSPAWATATPSRWSSASHPSSLDDLPLVGRPRSVTATQTEPEAAPAPTSETSPKDPPPESR